MADPQPPAAAEVAAAAVPTETAAAPSEMIPGIAPELSSAAVTAGKPPARGPISFGPAILNYLKHISSGRLPLSSAQSQELTTFSSGSSQAATGTGGTYDLKTILDYISDPSNTAQSPPPASAADMTKPLSWYYISSSHNTYLSGHQLYGEASGAAYEAVLQRGCRCVEIDVWDGDEERSDSDKGRETRQEKVEAALHERADAVKNKISDRLHRHGTGTSEITETGSTATRQPDKWTTATTQSRHEPRVLHGYTLTKDVPFREVCEAIRDSAFKTSDLPVIVSLEVHAGAEQQHVMVDIMEECWKGLLVNLDTENSKVLPSPDSLRNKILVKVKASPLQPTAEEVAAEAARLKLEESETSSSSEDEKKLFRRKTATPKSKIISPLSALGKYTQAFRFKDLNTREALIPTHVFSLSEKKVMEVHAAPGPSIFSHNKNFLMRAYPSGTRISSSNLDPAVFWRKGVQMVALNWQKFDAGTMMNEAQFAGTGGWLLKPAGYHGSPAGETKIGNESQLNAAPRKKVQLTINILAAQHLQMKKSQDKGGRLSPYIKCELHVERPEEATGKPIQQEGHATEGEYKLKTKNSKTADPDFAGEVLRFPELSVVEELSFIRFKIMDDVLGKDDLLAWSCIRLDRLREGYRLVELLSADGADSDAILLVKVDKNSK